MGWVNLIQFSFDGFKDYDMTNRSLAGGDMLLSYNQGCDGADDHLVGERGVVYPEEKA